MMMMMMMMMMIMMMLICGYGCTGCMFSALSYVCTRCTIAFAAEGIEPRQYQGIRWRMHRARTHLLSDALL